MFIPTRPDLAACEIVWVNAASAGLESLMCPPWDPSCLDRHGAARRRKCFVQRAEDTKRVRVDWKSMEWKARFKQFHLEALKFRGKFDDAAGLITTIKEQDEVAFCKCYIRPDLLATRSDRRQKV